MNCVNFVKHIGINDAEHRHAIGPSYLGPLMAGVPVDYVAWNRGAHFVRPCPVALRRNKALHLTAQPSNLRFAACSAGERRD
ncbi:hypothetical protein CHL67_05595 [Prosthecochloris sp. GSB1]|nr:hypothetical protein CHL67_05595 [Prosthecochloris sp. GSB1]